MRHCRRGCVYGCCKSTQASGSDGARVSAAHRGCGLRPTPWASARGCRAHTADLPLLLALALRAIAYIARSNSLSVVLACVKRAPSGLKTAARASTALGALPARPPGAPPSPSASTASDNETRSCRRGAISTPEAPGRAARGPRRAHCGALPQCHCHTSRTCWRPGRTRAGARWRKRTRAHCETWARGTGRKRARRRPEHRFARVAGLRWGAADPLRRNVGAAPAGRLRRRGQPQ